MGEQCFGLSEAHQLSIALDATLCQRSTLRAQLCAGKRPGIATSPFRRLRAKQPGGKWCKRLAGCIGARMQSNRRSRCPIHFPPPDALVMHLGSLVLAAVRTAHVRSLQFASWGMSHRDAEEEVADYDAAQSSQAHHETWEGGASWEGGGR